MSDSALRDLLADTQAKSNQSPDNLYLLGAIDIIRAEIAARGGDPFANPSY